MNIINHKNLFLFNHVDKSLAEQIIRTFPEEVSFSCGDIIYSSESFFNALGIVASGEAYAFSDNDNNFFLKKFTSGMCFGATSLFSDNEPYISRIVAKTDVRILFLSQKFLEELFKRYPQIALNYIKFLSEKVRYLNRKLSVISSKDAQHVILKYLCSEVDKNLYAQIPQNMTVFAKMLGISRASLYRGLDLLEQSGKILRENNKIKVINYEKNY